ncbi:MAG: hypothetical protein IT427_10385 [Pirellulales bacterium]|nr:hypothetical protein [Pirellulales bacterium]
MDRRNTFMWMKDIVEHLRTCADQWQTSRAGDGIWAEAVRRDLDELRQLCEKLRVEGVCRT